MAWEYPQPLKIARVAANDLSAKQFRFVKIVANVTAASDGTNDQVDVCAAETDIPCGVLQNTPKQGEEAEICVSGVTKLSGSGDLTSGFPASPKLINTDGNGQAKVATSGDYVAGQLLIAPDGVNVLGTAMIQCANPWLKA